MTLKHYGHIFFREPNERGERQPTYWESFDEIIEALVEQQRSYEIVSQTEEELVLSGNGETVFYIAPPLDGFKKWIEEGCPAISRNNNLGNPLPKFKTRGVVFNLMESFSVDL